VYGGREEFLSVPEERSASRRQAAASRSSRSLHSLLCARHHAYPAATKEVRFALLTTVTGICDLLDRSINAHGAAVAAAVSHAARDGSPMELPSTTLGTSQGGLAES
jgi:hypothetical protein